MKILVTGGAGLIGSPVVAPLIGDAPRTPIRVRIPQFVAWCRSLGSSKSFGKEA